MGITPLRSVVVEAVSLPLYPQIKLFYSAKISKDMPFGDDLYALSRQHSSFSLVRFITKESLFSPELKHRRMLTGDIVHTRNPNTEYLISGSLTFVLGLKNILVAAGVERKQILTESYF